ncbi:hypothetical protein [Clostridium simiarum]|uniref:hypothetical protein n=1 Tax=Clostridium simiarum TaxID=2841506 RepID=UPI003CCED676
MFSHGKIGNLGLGCKQSNSKSISINKQELNLINQNSFNYDIFTQFYSCNAATPTSGDDGKSLIRGTNPINFMYNHSNA